MDVVLVSGRARGSASHPSRARTRVLAAELAAAGHSVRWVRPAAGAGPVEPVAGVELLPVDSQAPPFAAVAASAADFATERTLSLAIRRRLPDVVHVLGYGCVTSPQTAWVADRLGVPVVVSVEARELLCHRGTLVDESGADCVEWDDPARCTACCLAPFEGGLTARQAQRARSWWWRLLPAWSPYPKPLDFENRSDVLVGGFLAAAVVLVASDVERDLVVRAGVQPRRVEVVGSLAPSAASLEPVYDRVWRAMSG